MTKHRTIIHSHNRSNNKHQVNNNRTTALERTERTVLSIHHFQRFFLHQFCKEKFKIGTIERLELQVFFPCVRAVIHPRGEVTNSITGLQVMKCGKNGLQNDMKCILSNTHF